MVKIKIDSTGVKTVWDPDNNRPICTFYGGVFETDNKQIIAQLKKRGYIKDESEIEVEEADVKAEANDGKSRGAKSTGKDKA